MPKKKYSYTKDDRPKKKIKRNFLIIAEGDREDAYFGYFKNQQGDYKIDIKIVPREGTNSAPRHVDDRLTKYKESEEWLPLDDDILWFVFDVDKWGEQLHELVKKCEHDKTWNMAISNPCFEVWLHHHSTDRVMGMESCDDLKRELQNQTLGHFDVKKYAPKISEAVTNARNTDTHPEQIFPGPMQTKVYRLAESLLTILNR